MHRIERTFAGRKLVLETGRMARQAHGAVLVQYGETVALVTAVAQDRPTHLPFSMAVHSIEEAATHWRIVHEVLDEDLPHLERSHIVRYEDFCAQPLRVLDVDRAVRWVRENHDWDLEEPEPCASVAET